MGIYQDACEGFTSAWDEHCDYESNIDDVAERWAGEAIIEEDDEGVNAEQAAVEAERADHGSVI